MSVKLIAAAIVVAGGVGATASYFQHNPQALSALGPQLLSFRGPLASSGGGKYVPGKYYQICRNEYANHMKDMTQLQRREACMCFDKEFQTWSPAMQEAAKMAMHTAIIFSNVPTMQGFRTDDPGRLSRHEAQVRASQQRDNMGVITRNYADAANEKNLEKAKANPITTAVATARVTALARRCNILGSPFGLPNVGSAFGSVGTRR